MGCGLPIRIFVGVLPSKVSVLVAIISPTLSNVSGTFFFSNLSSRGSLFHYAGIGKGGGRNNKNGNHQGGLGGIRRCAGGDGAGLCELSGKGNVNGGI